MHRYDTPIGMRPVPGTLLKQFAIYILTNRPRGVLYVGMSSWLAERIRQHREGLIPGFTQRYRLKRLVYFEYLDSAALAIAREKRLKRWHREWKIELIERMNPTWRDLWPDSRDRRIAPSHHHPGNWVRSPKLSGTSPSEIPAGALRACRSHRSGRNDGWGGRGSG